MCAFNGGVRCKFIWRLSDIYVIPIWHPSDTCLTPMWRMQCIHLLQMHERVVCVSLKESFVRSTPNPLCWMTRFVRGCQADTDHDHKLSRKVDSYPSDTYLTPVCTHRTPVWHLSDTCLTPIWHLSDICPHKFDTYVWGHVYKLSEPVVLTINDLTMIGDTPVRHLADAYIDYLTLIGVSNCATIIVGIDMLKVIQCQTDVRYMRQVSDRGVR